MRAIAGRVTVITPVYNGAQFIAETLDSVLAQRYPDLEYIVLDDGSTDGTPRIVESYGDRIRVMRQPNEGETRTVNKGLALAQGEFLCVVNADDPLRPGAIACLARALRLDPEALLAYPDWVEIDAVSRAIREVRLPQYDLRTMLETFNVGMGPGVLLRKRALDIVGLRDTSLRYTGDIDLWFRLALHGTFVHVPELLATHRVHPSSASVSNRGSKMADEVAKVAHKCCNDPHFPEELRREQELILGKAHFVASHYCGPNLRGRFAHLAKSVHYARGLLLRLVARHLRYLVLSSIPAPARNALKRMLGRERRNNP